MDEKFNEVYKMLQKDKFATQNGITITSITLGSATAEMIVNPSHLNGAGTIQGGAIFTLADYCFAAAANSYGIPTVSLDSNISFIKAISAGKLIATAVENYRRRTVAGYTVRITSENGELISIFNSTAYIKNK